MMDRAKLKGIGALLLVFALGLLVGGAGSRIMMQRQIKKIFRDPPAMFNARRLGALSRRLDLNDAERANVAAVMAKYSEQRRTLNREIMDRCGAPLRAQKAQMDAEIRAVLTPEQRVRYDKLVKDSDSHPPHGGPPEMPDPLP